MLRRFIPVALFTLALLALPSAARGWGQGAERLIANNAVETLPHEMAPFFEANRRFLEQHVTDPGQAKANDPAALRNGFIQLDHYGLFPFTALPRDYKAALAKYGRRALDKYGLLPWQIGLCSQKLTDALRTHDWNSARTNAAILAHYVAAAHDPFNTTVNNDGQLSGQPGVNQRYSSALVDRYQLLFFVKPNEAALIQDPTAYAFDITLRAHAWLENVLLADQHAYAGLDSYSDSYYDRFYAQAGAVLIRQLSDASADVGSYWMTAWINAGRPQLPSQ